MGIGERRAAMVDGIIVKYECEASTRQVGVLPFLDLCRCACLKGQDHRVPLPQTMIFDIFIRNTHFRLFTGFFHNG
jgi:hypothetical protein